MSDALPGGPDGELDPNIARSLTIEIVWLHDDQCHGFRLTLANDPPLTFAALLAHEAITRRLPTSLLQGRFGLAVYGHRRRLDDLVKTGDRVEIVPPLLADPKDSRRDRVEAKRRTLQRDRWHTN